MTTKHIHIHVGGRTKDGASSSQITEAKSLLREITSKMTDEYLKSERMTEGDMVELVKALRTAKSWI